MGERVQQQYNGQQHLPSLIRRDQRAVTHALFVSTVLCLRLSVLRARPRYKHPNRPRFGSPREGEAEQKRRSLVCLSSVPTCSLQSMRHELFLAVNYACTTPPPLLAAEGAGDPREADTAAAAAAAAAAALAVLAAFLHGAVNIHECKALCRRARRQVSV